MPSASGFTVQQSIHIIPTHNYSLPERIEMRSKCLEIIRLDVEGEQPGGEVGEPSTNLYG